MKHIFLLLSLFFLFACTPPLPNTESDFNFEEEIKASEFPIGRMQLELFDFPIIFVLDNSDNREQYRREEIRLKLFIESHQIIKVKIYRRGSGNLKAAEVFYTIDKEE